MLKQPKLESIIFSDMTLEMPKIHDKFKISYFKEYEGEVLLGNSAVYVVYFQTTGNT